MADIAKDALLTPDESALEGASQLFSYLWNGAWQYGHDTATGDADALHDMRVNLRRLRTAMQNFEGPKNAPILSSPLRGELRAQSARVAKLGDALGKVRDCDVLGEYVASYAKKKLDAEVESVGGLSKFVHYLQLQRAKAFKPMIKRVGRAQQTGELREQFARWSLGLSAADGTDATLQTVAKIILSRRLGEVEAHTWALEPDAHPEARHDLRKAIRRVRYTLETLSVCFEADVKPYVAKLVDLQDLLGEMQDHEVIAQTCAQCFGKSEPKSIVAFNAHGTRRISQLLSLVRTKWDETNRSQFWEELKGL